ncbi:MAG: glycosyltransferase family A protein [Nitrospirota bacterium]
MTRNRGEIRSGAAGEQPLASVVIPAYNAAPYIAATVESVLAQTYGAVEVIVVDDGSTDETKALLAGYRAAERIRYCYQCNTGPSAARNRGMLLSRGAYLIFLDADDLLSPGYVDAAVRFMAEYRQVDFVFSNYELFDEGGVVAASGVDRWKIFRSIPHFTVGGGRWLFAESLTRSIIQYGGFMTTSSVAFRKEALGNERFREGFFYGEDDEFFARVNYRSKAGYIDRVLVSKRVHGRSIIHDRSKSLRNAAHFIALAELQRVYYREDPAIRAVLEQKIPALTADYCWHLIDRGQYRAAQEMLAQTLRRYPKAYPLYKLLVKSYLRRIYRAAGA